MLAKVYSFGNHGIDGYPVEVQVDTMQGMPLFEIVGLPDAAIKEARERVRAAMIHSGFSFPVCRTVVNLAPGDIKKAGSAFDLPIAVGMLISDKRLPQDMGEKTLFLGELALDGAVRPIRGVLSMIIAARANGFDAAILPAENAQEAACVEGIRIYAAKSLRDVSDHLLGQKALPMVASAAFQEMPPPEAAVDFSDIRGLFGPKRALEIAAAGGHNALLIGAPGGGKTLLARSLPGLLPDLTFEEALAVTQISSITGDIPPGGGLVRQRPFRSPHHSASGTSLVGGGIQAMPGEITKAHHGVLFLDELAEFKRDALEALRQPLEDGFVTIARTNAIMTYPCTAMLIAAMNPCPCGYHGSTGERCRCSAYEIKRYLSRISGPMLDRMDLHVTVESVPVDDLLADYMPQENSSTVRARVNRARKRQQARYVSADILCNAHLDARQLSVFCRLSTDVRKLLHQASERFSLTARALTRMIKVARTIADLADCEDISAEHVAEAIQYRTLDRKIWG